MKSFFCVLLIFAVCASAHAQPASSLPRQDIVLVIDNSGSMENPPVPSDPLRLRGVAGSLILDAAELASDVNAGLVIFSDESDTDRTLKNVSSVKMLLRANHLQPAYGGTNMLDALEVATSMLSGSTADIKRIVMITDGIPNSGQRPKILSNVVPAARQARIQIFAIGLSNQIDAGFLEQVTVPTGGRTLVAPHHSQLLRTAKLLMGNQDNVAVAVDAALPSSKNDYSFTIKPGTDRARLTIVLDDARRFRDDEIEFSLSGPPAANEMTYDVRSTDGDRVAAWTAFFSAPGTYTLHVSRSDHGGLHLFIEELSDLHVAFKLDPDATQYQFGETVKIHVDPTTASGPLNDASLKINGTDVTSAGGRSVIAFSGNDGTFRVPAVAGVHTITVTATTKIASAARSVTYEALPPQPANLVCTPSNPAFDRPLGPTAKEINAAFRLVPEFPPDAKPHAVKVGFMIIAPVGEAQLVLPGGSTHAVNGPAFFMLQPAGEELTLRIRLDPNRPLPRKAERQKAMLRVVSNETMPLDVPLEYDVRIPQFEVRGVPSSFGLWWDAKKPRIVHLGRLHTDLESASTFVVTMPQTILYPKRGTQIADLSLRVDGNTIEPQRSEGASVRYGPIDLAAGHDAALDVFVMPRSQTGWSSLPAAQTGVDIDVASELGMSTKISTIMKTAGPPLFGRIDLHGRAIVTAVALFLALAIVARLAWLRFAHLWRFRAFLPGRVLPLEFGAVLIGDAAAESVALALPRSGSTLDDEIVGHVVRDGRRQRIDSSGGRLITPRPQLGAGDSIAIVESDEEGQLWELSYVGPVPSQGGEVEVTSAPVAWTAGAILRRLLFGLAIALALYFFLASDVAAGLAYGIAN